MSSVFDTDDRKAIRTDEAIAPSEGDTPIAIYRRTEAMVGGQTSGGAQVDKYGAQLLTSNSSAVAGYSLYASTYGCGKPTSGREQQFGGENSAITLWKWRLPWYKDAATDTPLIVEKGDRLKATAEDGSVQWFEIVYGNVGATFGSNLKVYCQQIENE
jgi:hypothetical protein